jgi:hypothetical protein
MSGLDDLERKLKKEVLKEIDKLDNKSEFENKWEMNKARMGHPSPKLVFGGLKVFAYGVVKSIRKIRDF